MGMDCFINVPREILLPEWADKGIFWNDEKYHQVWLDGKLHDYAWSALTGYSLYVNTPPTWLKICKRKFIVWLNMAEWDDVYGDWRATDFCGTYIIEDVIKDFIRLIDFCLEHDLTLYSDCDERSFPLVHREDEQNVTHNPQEA